MKMACAWDEDFEGNWETGCGHTVCINEGTPRENGWKFCCYCGAAIEEHAFHGLDGLAYSTAELEQEQALLKRKRKGD